MGSLLRRSLLLSINNIKNNKKIWISKRLQQTNAAFNSTNETQQQQSSNNVTPIFRNAIKYGDKIALKDLQGDYTYRGLYLSSRQFSLELSSILNGHEQERISFLMPNDASYVIVQWACWMSGHIAVPLNTSSPQLLLDYYINDSDSKLIITTKENLPIIEPLLKNTNRKLIIFDDTLRLLAQQPDNKITNNKLKIQLPPSPSTTTTATINNNKKFIDTQYDDSYYNDKIAMFVYTSGTTGKPKGVVMTFKNIQSQINSLINAWKWNDKDIILHTLPLNHIHGIINVLMCPLTIGAKCILLPKFQTSSVWSYLLAINMQNNDRCNIFMAVPTIYMKLIHEYDQLFSNNNKIKDYVYNVCSTRIRLMVSGSAPLPKPIFDRWEEITGHRLLERYGMTETGMVLSNPLEGQRIPGTHGTPLPGVEVRITKNNKNNNNDSDVLVQGTWHGSRILTNEKGVLSGELQVKGDNVFREYWNKPDETKKEFTKDGWFKTGDTVQYDNRIYSILGRSSVDIIKTGGFKVSALQVETAILGHPDIIDCAVVGLPDITWGQKVAAVVVAREGTEIILSQLREFGKKLLPEYAVPTVLKVVDKIPKNNMGKVNKPNLLAEVFPKNQI